MTQIVLTIVFILVITVWFSYLSYDWKFKKCITGCNRILLRNEIIPDNYLCKKCGTNTIYDANHKYIEFKINNDLLVSSKNSNKSKIILNYVNQKNKCKLFELAFDTRMYFSYIEINSFESFFKNIRIYNINKFINTKKEAEEYILKYRKLDNIS